MNREVPKAQNPRNSFFLFAFQMLGLIGLVARQCLRPIGHTSHSTDRPQDRRRDHCEELGVLSDFEGGGSKIVIYESPQTCKDDR